MWAKDGAVPRFGAPSSPASALTSAKAVRTISVSAATGRALCPTAASARRHEADPGVDDPAKAAGVVRVHRRVHHEPPAPAHERNAVAGQLDPHSGVVVGVEDVVPAAQEL